MRRFAVHVLFLALGALVWSPAAQAASPPTLSEFRLYFLHLANLDAAADKADADGMQADTDGWRTYEQERAALTDREGAILKDVAYRCNQALQDREAALEAGLEVPKFLDVVREAVEELETLLGPAAFESVSSRIVGFLRPAIAEIPLAAEKGLASAETEEPTDDEIPVETESEIIAMQVLTLVIKMDDGSFVAQCATTPNDSFTTQYYSGVTYSCTLRGTGMAPIPIACAQAPRGNTCIASFGPAPPGHQRWTEAAHGVRMGYHDNCRGSGSPGYLDQFRYCHPAPFPHFMDIDLAMPLGGTAACLSVETCQVATSAASWIAYLDIAPRQATITAGAELQLTTSFNMQASWSVVSGPGTIDHLGLYKAPGSVESQQTATIKACDLYSPRDCVTAAITVTPLTVKVSASELDLPPTASIELTATLNPAVEGQEVEWSATPELGIIHSESNNTASYTVFRDDLIDRTTEVTIKACLKPALTACGTVKVTVEKLLFMVTAPKTKLAPGESVQVTAFVGNSRVPRNVVWTDPRERGEGTLTVINSADPFIRLYTAPSSPIDFGINIEVCLEDAPGYCAYLHMDLGSQLTLDGIFSDTGRWQAGVLTPFTITGTGFTATTQVFFGDLYVTLTSVTDTAIRGKVNIVVPATALFPKLKQTYTGGGGTEITRSPIPVEPAILTILPPSAQIQAGGTVSLAASCQTSTAAGCTSLEVPTWSVSPPGTGTITGPGILATYTAPASVQTSTAVSIQACWTHGEQKLCVPAPVTVQPNGPIVAVSPKTASLQPGQTQQFLAQVDFHTNTSVNWSATAGTISASGLYRAPDTFGGATTVTVTATSVADSSRKDTATVTLVPAPLTVTSNASPPWVNHGTAITWTATASGGSGTGRQYALVRKVAGTGTWSVPAWQSSNVLGWTPGLADAGNWEISVWARDSLTPAGSSFGASFNPGPVQVRVPLTVACSASPAYVNPGTAITWTATASGGDPATIRYAFFRKKTGAASWTPDVTAASWQASNTPSWTPASTDVGTWEFSIWVKDANTPANANTYGFASYCNPGPTQVVAPLTLTSTASPVAAYSGQPIRWTMTATGGVPGTIQYAWNRRRAGTNDWIGSGWVTSNEVTWTPSAAEAGATWDFSFLVKDSLTTPTQNTYGYAAWYNPASVPVVNPPTVTCTASPASATHGTTLSWTATVSGGTGVGRQYAFFRKRSGAVAWTPAVTAPAWQPGNVMTWTPGSADVGAWDTYIWVKDNATPASMSTYGYAVGCNPGGVQIVAPLGVTSTASPAVATHGNAINWTATATGGVPASTQFAVVRRVGTGAWSAPVWQTSNVLSWTPASTDVNTWQISIWVRDGNTPAGTYAASYNPGSVQVVAPLSVTGTSSPAAYYHSNPITWTATGSGGTGAGRQYALFRLKSGTSNWIPSETAPAWQTNNQMSWTPGPGDVGTWTIVIWFKDANTPANANGYGYGAYYNAGSVQVYAHPAVSGTGSPSSVNYGTTITWTASGSGGIGSAKQYALFRKKVGTSNWIPALTSPGWQTGNVLSWTPGSVDVGTWEIFVWMKDANTPPTMNTYGQAAWYNAGLVEVVGPLSLTSCTPSPVSANYNTPITWTVAASGGHTATVQYALFRKRTGSSTWVPAQTSPAWQSGSALTWTPGSGDVGGWDISIWIRDGNTPPGLNTYGYAASCSPGTVQVTAPLGLSVTGTPSSSPYGTTITWTAYASGGHPPTTRYAFFRRPSGSGNSGWIPSIYSPAWQASNVMSWTPASSDAGSWDIYVWVKDGSTPPTQNTYGYAAGANGGSFEVTAPLYQDSDPIGWVDGVDNQWIWGWACDPDYPWESNRVDLWTTSWQYLGSVEANGWSSTPINNACGGGSAHYFSFYHGGSIPSGTHFWVWSIDLPYGTPNGVNVPIGGSGGNEFVMP